MEKLVLIFFVFLSISYGGYIGSFSEEYFENPEGKIEYNDKKKPEKYKNDKPVNKKDKKKAVIKKYEPKTKKLDEIRKRSEIQKKIDERKADERLEKELRRL
jgi:hypothetical protein